VAAKTKRSQKQASVKRKVAKCTSRKPSGIDTIAPLKSDHCEVEKLFDQFEKARAADKRRTIVQKVCDALTVHVKMEEEIFYPQTRNALKRSGENLLDEAQVEHQGIKRLVAELKDADPSTMQRSPVLKEYVKHHVKEEEGDLFAKVRKRDLDTEKVGPELAARKEALSDEPVKAPRLFFNEVCSPLQDNGPAGS